MISSADRWPIAIDYFSASCQFNSCNMTRVSQLIKNVTLPSNFCSFYAVITSATNHPKVDRILSIVNTMFQFFQFSSRLRQFPSAQYIKHAI